MGIENIIGQHIGIVQNIGDLIENNELYMETMREYLPQLKNLVVMIFEMNDDPANGFQINKEFVLQVLQDVMYGMEHEDSVYLLDVLRYGLCAVLYYIQEEV